MDRNDGQTPDPLKASFDRLAAASDGLTLSELRSRIAAKRMEETMDTRITWRRLRAATVGGILAVIAACTVPVNYERETGLDVSLAVEGDVQPLLAGLKTGPWSVASLAMGAQSGPYREISATLFGAARDDAERLRDLPGVGSLQVASHSESASGTLYDIMVDRFFRVEISIAGKTEEEINQAVADALTAQGFEGGVSLSRGQNGEIHLMTDGIDSQGEGITQVQIMLSDADTETEGELIHEMHGSMPRLDLGDLDGLTADQIKARVQQQLADNGIDTESVHVHVGGDDETGSEAGAAIEKRIELRVVVDEEAVGDGE
ncbi:MAG: hypothetical protein HOM68_23650 [Gemmatimonadetes bacterium]|jgi:hypothetical protein|nr:hypothetical protein [Gemmatimonadota bacterium]MBT5059561.1 hypothetical protein [Gemmatimonadota bacterium]MBT5144692.1 hypothetical protein [Gemmatimonadota bacterium]MBT5587346.1 hypothetical protein [Gemmatimonadota bacterium]MBT5963303.1 hypothetical protein [Gemmatimonadota bacterium]